MAETDLHRKLLLEVVARLEARYADNPNAYVSGNLLVYYEEGNKYVSLAPDGFVVFGVPNRLRKVYKTWEEGKCPEVVFEFTSKSTRQKDVVKKFNIYQNIWKVKEYFLFDPFEDYLKPSLQGFRLQRGVFKPMKAVNGVLTSDLLGITIERDGQYLLMRDGVTGEEVLTDSEREARIAQQFLRDAEQRANAAVAELARVKAELDALRKQSSKK